MATVTAESLKSELDVFGITCLDESALDKSKYISVAVLV